MAKRTSASPTFLFHLSAVFAFLAVIAPDRAGMAACVALSVLAGLFGTRAPSDG